MPSWEPVPGYTNLCQRFRRSNSSKDCTWNILTTVWEVRGLQAYGGQGNNNLVIRVEHFGVSQESKTYERTINQVSNRVFRRDFLGQPNDFFASSVMVLCFHKKLIGEEFIGQVEIGVLDVFMSPGHMVPMQWFALVDPKDDIPAEPRGFIKLNVIINTVRESGAVQNRAPDEVADWELNRHDVLQIPRLNFRKVACHQYNLKFLIYQGYDLGDGSQFSMDAQFRVSTPCGDISTDPYQNSLRPKWNCKLQIPFYEPTFRDLILCEIRDAGVDPKCISKIYFSWKDLFIRIHELKEPKWIDMYERQLGLMEKPIAGMIPFLGGRSPATVAEQLGVAREPSMYREPSVYCGRVLLSVEIEERSDKREPSPAQIAMKPKDCIDLWADPSQKLFFRFSCIYGQDFPVDPLYSYVQVEFNVGRRSTCTLPQKMADTGLFPFLQSMEVEMDLPFDDKRDNPEGEGKPSSNVAGLWKPLAFIERLPDIFVKVYKVTNPLLPDISRQIIGMWRGSVISVLGGGDPEGWMQNCYIGNEKADNQTAGLFDGVSSIALAPGEDPPVPSKHFPWGKHGTDPEQLLTHRILNPYTGFQMVRLVQDASCALGPEDPSGFVGFSCKLWMPSRFRCSNVPPKGPPILSPWRMWNTVPILPPWHDYLKWFKYFTLRAHIYQAQDLAARNSTGVANAFVELRCLKQEPKRTHTAYMTNHPTFDTTLDMPDVPLYLLPTDPAVGAEEYRQLCNPSEPVDATDVDSNHSLLRMSPRFEIRVYEENGEAPLLIGRQYISAHEVLTRKVDPTLMPIFKGNPDVHEGKVYCSFQVIESSENLLKAPLRPLIPDRSFVKMEQRETWTSPAPQRPVKMFECKIQIQVLGLRDLTSPYPFGRPVLKPQIEVCCDDPKTAITTKPSGKPSGPDANFLECVDIAVLMPEDKDFAPVIEVFVYDHSLYGQDVSFVPSLLRPIVHKPAIVAYGSMPTQPFYASDESDVGSDDGSDEENEEAAKKRKAKEELKKFSAMAQELRRSGKLGAPSIKTLEKLFAKKDEAVVGAFKQYTDDADASKFADRITSFIIQSNEKAPVAAPQKQPPPPPPNRDSAASATGQTAAEDLPENRTDVTDNESVLNHGLEVASAEGEADAEDDRRGAAEAHVEAQATGIDEADKGSNADRDDADPQDAEEPDEIGVAEGLTGEDDQLPDKQEIVDTPDGKPNLEWLLLRAHPMLNCPMEHSTVEQYGVKNAWQPRFSDVFDEIALFRDPIDPVRRQQVGTLKCKVKLFKLESDEVAEQRGEEPRWLDMNELKRGNEVEYEVPDVNENFPGRDVEVRVYLLRAFQISPTQVVDGIAKANNIVKLRVGGESWDWTTYYDPVPALNPHFYQCAKIIAKLPGPSMLHVQLLDDTQLGFANPLADFLDPIPMQARFNFGNPSGPQLIGETVIDLEDRWFCKEWTDNTVYKPREVRDLYNPKQPGLSVGKMMVMIDAVLFVDSDEKPPRNVNIAGRQMPMEMRVIVWNLRDVSPKEGYTSNVQVGLELMGWGREKETDQDIGVKQSRLAMFNYRLKFKGLKFPSPDPTIPAKDFLLKVHVSSADFLGIGPNKTIAEGLIPLQPLFLDCFQKNLGKGSPDDMEIVSLDTAVEGGEPAGAIPGALDPGFGADSEGTRYPYKWYRLVHPGGPGCKNDKDFAPPGYDFVKNCQCKIQLTIQIMPRAKGRAVPATNGFSRGPAKLVDPNRPPQPKNPIFDPVGCGKYIAYSCRECCLQCKWPCLCICCILLIVVFFIAYFYLNQVGLVPKL